MTRTATSPFTWASLITALLVSACAYSPQRHDRIVDAPSKASTVPSGVQWGRVNDIDMVPIESTTSGGGAVLGAVLGAVVGNQIGGGTGRVLATGVGVVGGAVVGNTLEKRHQRDGQAYRVSVRLDNGQHQVFDFLRIDDLRVGDRVKVENGQLYRL